MNVLPFCCFAPINWYQIAARENFIIDVFEHYPKQTFRNRFEILSPNGRLMLTIPVRGQKGVKIPFRDIELADGSWRRQHVNSLSAAYGKAAFFDHLSAELFQIFQKPHRFLHAFNQEAFDVLNQFTGIGALTFSKQYVDENEMTDFRNDFEPTGVLKSVPEYPQVFSDRFAFQSNLSIIDLAMNIGPAAATYLRH